MEFSTYEEMIKFEAERERYYLNFIHICDSFDPFRFKFYKQLFLETFHPKYRFKKKLYDGYYGGWGRDSEGHPCANSIQLIDIASIMDNPITDEFILLVNKIFKDHPTYCPGQEVEIDIEPPKCGYDSKTVNELCSNCIHKDVFWKNAGCNLKNGMEPCKFEPKEK